MIMPPWIAVLPSMPCRDDVDDDGWIVNFEWDSIVATNFRGRQGRKGWFYVLGLLMFAKAEFMWMSPIAAVVVVVLQ